LAAIPVRDEASPAAGLNSLADFDGLLADNATQRGDDLCIAKVQRRFDRALPARI
jgi:hypothetical protein